MSFARPVYLALALAFSAGLAAHAADSETETAGDATEASVEVRDAEEVSPRVDPNTSTPRADIVVEENLNLPRVLDLETCQQVALEQNPSLHAAASRIAQAEARLRQSEALYYPQLIASYSAAHTELANSVVESARRQTRAGVLPGIAQSALGLLTRGGNTTGGSPLLSVAVSAVQSGFQAMRARDAVEDSAKSYNASVVASYLIFDGFGRKFTRLAAKYGAQEFEAARVDAQRLLLAAVAQSYYGLQLARENGAIATADLAFNERLLKESEVRRRVGTGSLSDVLNFEVRVRSARSAELQARNDFRRTRIALAALMGLPDATLPEEVEIAELTPETPEELERPEAEQGVAHALEYRPDLQQNDLRVDIAETVVGQRRSLYYPAVSAGVAHDAVRNRNTAFEEEDFATTVSLNVSYDIFVGGRRKAEVAEAKSSRAEAEFLFEDARLNAIADVRQAVVDVENAQELLVLQRTTTEYVERNRELVEKEYDAGQAALTRLNEAQRDLIEAQSRLVLARVSLRQAWHNYYTATAETLSWYPEALEAEDQ